MRIAVSTEISAPQQDVWDYVIDPDNYLHFMSGITRWEVASDAKSGLGARYRMLMRAGSAEVGGLIEVVEFHAPCDMAWSSVQGLDQRGRWRVRAIDEQHCRVEFRFAYGVAGAGIGGWLAERAAAPTVSRHLRRSLHQLKRQVEHDQFRAHAARRRAERESKTVSA